MTEASYLLYGVAQKPTDIRHAKPRSCQLNALNSRGKSMMRRVAGAPSKRAACGNDEFEL